MEQIILGRVDIDFMKKKNIYWLHRKNIKKNLYSKKGINAKIKIWKMLPTNWEQKTGGVMCFDKQILKQNRPSQEYDNLHPNAQNWNKF